MLSSQIHSIVPLATSAPGGIQRNSFMLFQTRLISKVYFGIVFVNPCQTVLQALSCGMDIYPSEQYSECWGFVQKQNVDGGQSYKDIAGNDKHSFRMVD